MRIAVYGANGFTGRLAVAELAHRGITSVPLGRSDAPADDVDALTGLFDGCDAVVNCAGPFTTAGDGVARAAIAARAHYVDTTGEQMFLKHIFDTLAADAEAAGVTLVPAMTDDGLPGDAIAHLTAAKVGVVDRITIADMRADGAVTRGTARSALSISAAQPLRYENGEWVVDGTPAELPGLATFPLPGVITVPRHVKVRQVTGAFNAALAGAFSSVTPELAEAAPTEVERASDWRIEVYVTGVDGTGARGAVWGSDPYGSTAIIAVEGARRLAAGDAEPGVLAPALAYDPADFLDFLTTRGVSWQVG